jgi:LacI family transcriptional regulator
VNKKGKHRGERRGVQDVTIDDVAAMAGVSAMTVSRALTGRVRVSSKTQARVRHAVDKLNYRPNSAARYLAGGLAHRIGLLYSNPSQAYLSELLVGALEESAAQGLQIALGRADAPVVQACEITSLLESGIDAFILPPSVCDKPEVLRPLKEGAAIWVAISPADSGAHPLSVTVDDMEAAKQITTHLVNLGHQRVGFIVGDPAYRASADRYRGYCKALEEAQLAPGPVEQGYFTFQSGLEATERLLRSTPRCTAIFASNDDMAAAVIALAHRLGIDVPRDLSVVGFDDTPFSSTVSPTITTVRQPIAQMAQGAVQMLAQAIRRRGEGHTVMPQQRRFNCTLLERQSCGPKRVRSARR